MQIQFGESVRRLRQEKGLTQETLAAQLHVSFQTISKWERDESHPDLTMLPVLAQFFGVSTDDLLGVNEAENERRVREIIEAYESNRSDLEHLTRLKAAVAEYPLDYRLWVRYMECLLHCGGGGLDFPQETSAEVRAIYENIVTHCTDDSVRLWAKRLFVMHLHSLAQPKEPGDPLGKPGLQREAEQILGEMPSLRASREHVAVMVSLPGEAHLRGVQDEIAELLWMLAHAIGHHDVYGKAFPGEPETFPFAREICFASDLTLRLLDLFCPDGDYGKNHFIVVYSHGYRAFYSAVLGEYDQAFEAMRLCAEQARAFDALPQVMTHTSPLLQGLTYDKNTQDRVMTARMHMLFQDRYPWPEEFRQDARFAEIMRLLNELQL